MYILSRLIQIVGLAITFLDVVLFFFQNMTMMFLLKIFYPGRPDVLHRLFSSVPFRASVREGREFILTPASSRFGKGKHSLLECSSLELPVCAEVVEW